MVAISLIIFGDHQHLPTLLLEGRCGWYPDKRNMKKEDVEPLRLPEAQIISVKKTKKNKPRRDESGRPDRLLLQLELVEKTLQRWISGSPENATLFRQDPIAAMRQAGLNIDDDIMLELELITSSIAKKLK